MANILPKFRFRKTLNFAKSKFREIAVRCRTDPPSADCPLPTVYWPLSTVLHCPLSTSCCLMPPCPLPAHCLLPAALCPLSTAHCPLSAVHCPVPNAHSLLSTVYYPLFTAQCLLPTVYCPMFTAQCLLPSSFSAPCLTLISSVSHSDSSQLYLAL